MPLSRGRPSPRTKAPFRVNSVAGTGGCWPSHLPVATVRFARPTARLEECSRFYRDVLGLKLIAEFSGHDGYDGIVVGLPDHSVQLELTSRGEAPKLPEPSAENQLVLYLADSAAVAEVAARMANAGVDRVEPENPYWTAHGAIAFADPDGWLVVFVPGPYPA